MEISALANSLSAQTTMGMLLVKVLDQTQAMIQQQVAINIAQSQVSIDGLGENIDISA